MCLPARKAPKGRFARAAPSLPLRFSSSEEDTQLEDTQLYTQLDEEQLEDTQLHTQLEEQEEDTQLLEL